MKLAILAVLCAVGAVSAQDLLPEPTQRTDVPYRLFRTRNMYTFLKLDTRTGQIWHVQWSVDDAKQFIYPLNLRQLADNKKPGRFTLTPTTNIFNFILSDQEDGRQWQIQRNTEAQKRIVTPIEDEPGSAITSAPTAAGQWSPVDFTPAKSPVLAENARPVRPVFGDKDGETWEKFEQRQTQWFDDLTQWAAKQAIAQDRQDRAGAAAEANKKAAAK